MARRNEKYTPEMREQTAAAAYILESGKSATKTAKEMGIDVNTVCRWVQDYRKKHNLPSYAEEKGLLEHRITRHIQSRSCVRKKSYSSGRNLRRQDHRRARIHSADSVNPSVPRGALGIFLCLLI